MLTIAQINEVLGGKISGDPEQLIKGVCDLKDSREGCISYLNSGRYEEYFEESCASAVLVSGEFSSARGSKTLIEVENPALSFIDVVHLFHSSSTIIGGIHANAVIAESAVIGENVSIGANTVVGENVQIGYGSIIYPNVTIYQGATLGDKCIIDSGTVIGGDGFGLVTEKGTHHKIPHIGRVVLEDNVWIGSNCSIDRGTFGDTVIGTGSKLDNLIHIAHNVKLGKGCVLAGQVGIAGSTVVEDFVTIAGQVGIVGHLTIGKNSVIASKSAVYQSIKPGAFVSGIPARPHQNRLRQDVVVNQLPEILKRLRKLEQQFSITEEQ